MKHNEVDERETDELPLRVKY
jgi:hypothetical protein